MLRGKTGPWRHGQLPPQPAPINRQDQRLAEPPSCLVHCRLFPSHRQMKLQGSWLELMARYVVKPTPAVQASWDRRRTRFQLGYLPEHLNLLSWAVPWAAAQEHGLSLSKQNCKERLARSPHSVPGGCCSFQGGRQSMQRQRGPLLFPREGHRVGSCNRFPMGAKDMAGAGASSLLSTTSTWCRCSGISYLLDSY